MSDSASWSLLALGTELRIVKLAPTGRDAASYPGRVFDAEVPHPWVGVAATWERDGIELEGLRFLPGDQLHEFFSPADWFNVFSVWSPDGDVRGWYANITYPARLDATTNPPTLTWHDLYVDVIALPDGTAVVRDEEELAAAELGEDGPRLQQEIARACDELLRRFALRAFPFHERQE